MVGMASALFGPLTLRDVTLRNRVWVAPMCQYSVLAEDGVPTDWHLAHLGQLAAGGAGLVIAEATAVSPEGRISPRDTGLWNQEQADAWARIATLVADQGAVPGIQLGHAGRKASTYPGWGFPGRDGTVPAEEGGWPTLAPSPLAFGEGYAVPRELDAAGMDEIVADFAAAATRAERAGFGLVEIHAAHGYLLHQFLSPLSNRRDDEYGGSLENRARLLLRVVEAVREAAPGVLQLVRFSATDWTEGGLDVEEVAQVAVMARDRGADGFDVSTGGNVPAARIPVGPGYQVEFATRIREATGSPTAAVGLITEAGQAEKIVAGEAADAVLVARAALRNPHLPLAWAEELGDRVEGLWPPQYERARPRR
jgi:2,4-dienoyl-CoA reductase-like NADH-dependent reductase (Old Yellow Enzyme family)